MKFVEAIDEAYKYAKTKNGLFYCKVIRKNNPAISFSVDSSGRFGTYTYQDIDIRDIHQDDWEIYKQKNINEVLKVSGSQWKYAAIQYFSDPKYSYIKYYQWFLFEEMPSFLVTATGHKEWISSGKSINASEMFDIEFPKDIENSWQTLIVERENL